MIDTIFQAELINEFVWHYRVEGKKTEQKGVLPAGTIVDVYGFNGHSEVIAHSYCIIYHEKLNSLKAINISQCKPFSSK